MFFYVPHLAACSQRKNVHNSDMTQRQSDIETRWTRLGNELSPNKVKF